MKITVRVMNGVSVLIATSETLSRLLAVQGSYGISWRGWHSSKGDVVGDFDTVEDVLRAYGIDFDSAEGVAKFY